MKYKCPCCEYITLDENPKDPTFEICPVCCWENDPLQSDKPDYCGGPNRVSLIQAKKNFKLFGAAKERSIKCVREPLPEEFELVT
jgi:hypothetical protein